jgi:type-F conjugative transfer system protein TrbI
MPLLSQSQLSTSQPSFHPVLRTLVRGVLIALLLIGANVAATILWRMYDPAPRLVTVDLNGIVQTFIAGTAESDLSDDDKRARTETFARELDRALQGLAARQHMIILPAPAVIAGAQDITEAVEKGLKP